MSERDQAPGHADGTVPEGWHGLDGTPAGDAPGTRPMSMSQDGWAAVDGGPDAATGPMPPEGWQAEGWQAEGQPTGRFAGAPDVHWNTHPAPPPPPPPPPPPGPFVPPPGQRPARRKGPLIALAAAATVLVAGVVTAVVVAVDGDDDSAAGDRGSVSAAGTSGGSGSGTATSACDQAPEVTVSGVRTHATALEVSTQVTASCADGDLWDGPISVIATSGNTVVGSTRWSLDDVSLSASSPTELTVAFNPEDVLLPRSVLRDMDLDIAFERGASSPSFRPGDSESALDLLVAEDTSALRSAEGRWLPQVSAKRPGLVAPSLLPSVLPGEVHWDAETILAEHLALREKYPDAKLLYSGDWSTYDLPDFYVTVIADPQRSADATLSWCRAERLGHDDCLAKIVSDSRRPDGSTKHQRD